MKQNKTHIVNTHEIMNAYSREKALTENLLVFIKKQLLILQTNLRKNYLFLNFYQIILCYIKILIVNDFILCKYIVIIRRI